MTLALFSCSATADAGWGVFTVNYVKALAEHRDDFLLFLPANHPQVDFLPAGRVRYALPIVGEYYSPFDLIKLTICNDDRFRGFSAIHALTDSALAFLAGRLARKHRTRLILTCQGTFAVRPLRSRVYAPIQRALLRSAHVITCSSEFTRDVMLQLTGDPKLAEKFTVVRNGIDFGFFSGGQPGEMPDHQFRLIAVGGLKPRKGYDILLRALARLTDRHPELQLKIVGRGNQEPKLRALARELKIDGHVEFPGFLPDEDLRQALWSSHVYIHTPVNRDWRFEGFGMVYLEANAAGLPVIGSRSGGVPSAVLDGETGLLAEEGDVASTAAAIEALIEDPELRQRLSSRAVSWARHHDWSCVIRDFLPFYD